jgi:hypothetical protein
VAGGAIIVRADVNEGFAAGVLAIMAGFAFFGCQFVIKTGHAPGVGDVAVFAAEFGFYVAVVFAGGGLAVVAGEAFVLDFAVIHMHGFPVVLVVAISANIAGGWMIIGFAFGHIAIVAAGAGGGHAFENATGMAGFTGDFNVRAFQRELCEFVVE